MARASGNSASFKHAVSNCELSTPGIGASFSPLSMQVANTSSSSRTSSCKSPGSMVSLPSLSSSLPQMWVWTVPCDDEDADFVGHVLPRLRSKHDQEGSQGLRTQVHSCARKHTHTIEFNRNRIQWEGVIRKPGHNTFNSVFRETSQVQRLPTSNIRERSVNVETNTNSIAFRSYQRVITKKSMEKFIFVGRKLFYQGRRLQHIHDIIEFRRSSAVATDHRQEVDEADQHPCTSFVQDVTIQKQALLPSCTSHSSFRRVATLGSRHGMIPTWQRSRSRSVCVCGRLSQLPCSFSSGVQVPMPPLLRRRSIMLSVLSAVRGCVSQRPTE